MRSATNAAHPLAPRPPSAAGGGAYEEENRKEIKEMPAWSLHDIAIANIVWHVLQ